MPSQNRFAQSGYWCRWGGLSSFCPKRRELHRSQTLRNGETRGERRLPGGVSKYFKILQRKTPIGKYSIPHPYAPVKGLFSFFENFFERDLSRFTVPPHPLFFAPFSPPLIPLPCASATSTRTPPPPLPDNDGDLSLSPLSLCPLLPPSPSRSWKPL